jgi:hypothetical protein
MEVTAEIVDWDPPRAASWKTVQGSATLVAYCRVEPEHGGCRLTYGGEGKVTGLVGLFLNPIIKPPCYVAPDPISPDLRLPWRTAQPAR